MSIETAIVLAGGAGTRIWPFGDVRNKCAMAVGNVPNVRRLVDDLHAIGIARVVVTVGQHAGSIRRALLGSDPAVEYAVVDNGYGTAGATLAGFRACDSSRLLVVFGDTSVTRDDLSAVVSASLNVGTPGAALWDEMPHREGSLWYGARVENDRLVSVVGHDADARQRLCGVFVLDRSIVPFLEANPGLMEQVPVGGMPPLEADLAQSLNDWPGEVAAVRASERVVDIDKPWHILEANAVDALRRTAAMTENRIHPTARVHDGAEIVGFVEIGANSVIGNRVTIHGNAIVGAETHIVNGAILEGSTIVGDGCRISDYCTIGARSVIGNRCIVGHGAEMDGTMFDGAYLWHYCEISGLVGASVDIGAATVCGTLRFDDGDAEHRVRGRRERPSVEANATYFGDYCRTGVNVITQPGAKIGAYTCVGPGIVVYGDVPSRTLRLLKQETVDRPWGPERYGW